ncbi:MAG: DUF58 domain-containing protein [Moheibacter sp.]
MKLIRHIFLGKPFFFGFLIVVASFVSGFFFPEMISVSEMLLFAMILFVLIDLILLFSSRTGVSGERIVNDKLSNFDSNRVQLKLKNHFGYRISYSLIEELPAQFQIFDFNMKGKLSGRNEITLKYELTPKERGVYSFGNTNAFVSSPLGFLQRRIVLKTETRIRVYPSFLKLHHYSLQNFKAHLNEIGQKKIRRLGHSMEFEQIKNYVSGDDIRTINWKATAKQQKLMVNQYVDEKSQQIYCAIDKGRVMKMPFNGMTLLDYSINSALIFCNVVLQNHDRAGIFTFSSQLEDLVKAERRTSQIRKISESLYGISSDFKESDYGKLYNSIKHKITQRSLILIFTNFESLDSLHRQLPYLVGINKNHLLIPIFFRNTELEEFIENPTEDSDVYQRTMAEKFIYEKQQIVLELNRHGIQAILTRPEDLTVNTINKYLEIKSKGMI